MSKKEAKDSQYRYILTAAIKYAKRRHLLWNNTDHSLLTSCCFAYSGLNCVGVLISYAPKEKRIINIHFSCFSEDGVQYTRYINF